MAHAEVTNPGFSVADAEHPAFAWRGDDLSLEFLDMRKSKVQVVFKDAISFRWQAIDDFRYQGEQFDRCHLIRESDWLAEHVKQAAFSSGESYLHYKLNFNACGTLEVIAKNVELQNMTAPSS